MLSVKKIISCVFAAVFTLSSFAYVLHAQEPTVPLYSVEQFFAFPDTLGYSFHPNSEYLVFSAPVNGVINVFKRNIQTNEETQLTFSETQHIMGAFFKENQLLIMQDGFGDENFHIFRVEEDGTTTNLTPFEGAMALPINMLNQTDNTEEILIMSNQSDLTSFNTYRLNVFTGEIDLVFEGTSGGVLLDNAGVARILAHSDEVGTLIMYRHTDDDEFELVKQLNYRDQLIIMFFDPTNTYVYALTNIDRNTTALLTMNPATAEVLEVIFEVDGFDIGNIIQGSTPGTLGMAVYLDDFINVVFFDDELESIYNNARSHLSENDMVFLGSISEDRNIVFISTMSDVNQGRQYLFNRAQNTMTLMLDNNFAPPEHMAPMMPISYEARDGLTIPGYLTLPVGVEPYDLPVVVIVHGGPWARDVWGFNPEVQFLANRGYAVLQPNFRGSAGFGREFLDAGDRQWGLAMQDDITDGVLWLIEQGIADPNRIGIYGASYGGYATLAGITLTPELYSAAISYVGISSIFTLLDSLPPHWESERQMFYSRVGHPIYDYELLRATSPIYHVDNIITPLFVAHGANDVRTTLIESINIVQALYERGVDVEFMVRWDEGHGFIGQQNRIEFYATMEAFFAEHLGGRTSRTLDELDYTDTLEEVLAIWQGQNIDVQAQDLDLIQIPFNLDGNQGITHEIDTVAYAGYLALIFSNFTGGMQALNVTVNIGERVVFHEMGVLAGSSIIFEALPEDVGAVVTATVSTNFENGANATWHFTQIASNS